MDIRKRTCACLLFVLCFMIVFSACGRTKYYTVTFVYDGMRSEETTAREGDTVRLPVFGGYGWKIGEEFFEGGAEITVTGDLCFYAHTIPETDEEESEDNPEEEEPAQKPKPSPPMRKRYAFFYLNEEAYFNGEVYRRSEVVSGFAALPEIADEEKQEFLGWYLVRDGIVTDEPFTGETAGSVHAVARFAFYCECLLNDGERTERLLVREGVTFELPAPASSREFLGWDRGGVRYAAGERIVIETDVSFIAVYREETARIVYRYGARFTETVCEGETSVAGNLFGEEEGKYFYGWQSGSGFYFAGESLALQAGETVVLEAVFRTLDRPNGSALGEMFRLEGGSYATLCVRTESPVTETLATLLFTDVFGGEHVCVFLPCGTADPVFEGEGLDEDAYRNLYGQGTVEYSVTFRSEGGKLTVIQRAGPLKGEYTAQIGAALPVLIPEEGMNADAETGWILSENQTGGSIFETGDGADGLWTGEVLNGEEVVLRGELSCGVPALSLLASNGKALRLGMNGVVDGNSNMSGTVTSSDGRAVAAEIGLSVGWTPFGEPVSSFSGAFTVRIALAGNRCTVTMEVCGEREISIEYTAEMQDVRDAFLFSLGGERCGLSVSSITRSYP